jgi:phosphoserine aminotransferase
MLWDYIHSTNGYYKSKITDPAYHSRVNIVFRICGGSATKGALNDLEETFIREAKNAGIV